jgi:hypothetical protein
MLLNKFNLSISKHCTAMPLNGNATDMLHITENGTLISRGPYSVFVSAVSKHQSNAQGVMSPAAAQMTADVIGDDTIEIDPNALPHHEGRFPVHPQFLGEKPVIFEIEIDTKSLLQLAQEAKDFEGGPIRIRFTGINDPVRLDTRNATTGQTWEALMMPRLRSK